MADVNRNPNPTFFRLPTCTSASIYASEFDVIEDALALARQPLAVPSSRQGTFPLLPAPEHSVLENFLLHGPIAYAPRRRDSLLAHLLPRGEFL